MGFGEREGLCLEYIKQNIRYGLIVLLMQPVKLPRTESQKSVE